MTHTVMIFDGGKALQLRVLNGLSRPALASMVGTTRETVRRIEMGLYQPRPALVVEMAKVLGVDTADLYELAVA